MLDATAALGFGFVLGLSLAAPPGPVMALSAERAVHRGFWPGFWVILGAITADATHAVLVALGVVPLVQGIPGFLSALSVAGALLMLYLAWGAWQTARRPPPIGDTPEPPRKGLARLVRGGFAMGYAIAISSPFNIAWWLSVGPGLASEQGLMVFVGFFAALFAYAFCFLGLLRLTAGRVRGVVAVVSYASAVLLALFAARLLYLELAPLAGGA